MPRRRKGAVLHETSRSNSFKGSASCILSTSTNIKEKPVQRNAANARERARMRVLSRAFCRLKTTLPWVPADTKLSKLDTLRLASSYIAHLKGILQDDPFGAQEPLHPAINLTWPFGFNRGSGGGSGGGGGTGAGSHGGGSVNGSGSDEGEESDSNNSDLYWREREREISSKDCIHLDPSSRYNPLLVLPAPGLCFRQPSSNNENSHLHQQLNTSASTHASDVSSGFESNGMDFL